jgi:hypothetical protein
MIMMMMDGWMDEVCLHWEEFMSAIMPHVYVVSTYFDYVGITITRI